jgi:hypothetical protein
MVTELPLKVSVPLLMVTELPLKVSVPLLMVTEPPLKVSVPLLMVTAKGVGKGKVWLRTYLDYSHRTRREPNQLSFASYQRQHYALA